MRADRAYLWIIFFAILGVSAQIQAADSASMFKPVEAMLQNNEDMCSLGWSKAGSCAFIVKVDGGGRGGYALKLWLLDTVEDLVLFSDEAWSDELSLESEGPGQVSRALAISDLGKTYASACQAAKIEFGSGNPQIRLFPLRALSTTFTAVLVPEKSKEPLTDMQKDEVAYGAQKLDIQVIVRREGKGSKLISTVKSVMASSFDVTGFFLSPFESRILVLYRTVTPGFEGDPNIVFRFAGCHLDRGFKAP